MSDSGIVIGHDASVVRASLAQIVPPLSSSSDRLRLLRKERERLDPERRVVIEGISGLVSALEARDPYTRGHSAAVGGMVADMVRLSGADGESIEIAGLGGRLHDIGKIGVRPGILLKPGCLTAEEYAEVKQHPRIGARILRNIRGIGVINEIVLHHHERLDGRGYPEGLKGAKIPLWARITAVADTYHAAATDRPYRPRSSPERALEIIREVKGTQLCPECVDLFYQLIERREPNNPMSASPRAAFREGGDSRARFFRPPSTER